MGRTPFEVVYGANPYTALDMLWAKEGVKTWDAFGEEYFPMRAVLLCTDRKSVV